MRVSLVTETYYPQVNGVSRTLDNLIAWFLEQGDEIQLLTPKYRTRPGAPVGRKVARHDSFFAAPVPIYPEIRVPILRPGAVAVCLKAFNPDIVHIATEATLGFHALKAVQRLHLPVVSSYHTNFSKYTESYSIRWLAKKVWKYLRWFHNSTYATFCPTPSICNELIRRGFERVSVWGRGVDSRLFHPKRRNMELRRRYGVRDDDVLLIYVGRLAKEKNMNMLLDAVALLSGHDNVKLLLVGDGPLRPRLQARSMKNVIFTGYRHGNDLADHYASADIMTFPSLTETFGNVILEAMASGLPVVGFDAPGPRDVITPGKTGFVVPEIAPEPFAAAVAQLVVDADLRRRMSLAARAYAESQTWANTNRVVRNTYLQVLDSFPELPNPGAPGAQSGFGIFLPAQASRERIRTE